MPPAPSAIRMAVTSGLLVAVILAAIQLSGVVEPVDLLAPGRDGQGADIMVEDFGVEAIPDRIPFDGQYLYVTARLLPDLDAIADHIEESSYRLVRVLHPLLAAPGGSGTPVILLMQLWNVVGVGLLTWGLADILMRHHHDPGLAAAAPITCLLPLILTTSEPLAFGLGMAGLAMVDGRRLGWGILLLALGGLTRESALTLAVAAGLLLLHRRATARSVGAVLVGALGPTAAWWAVVQTVTPSSRLPVAPFGILQIADRWWVDIAATVLALALIAISVVAWWDVPPLRWTALAFAAWLPLYEEYAFKVVGLPRLSLPSIALGLAGIFRWRTMRGIQRPKPSPLAVSSGD